MVPVYDSICTKYVNIYTEKNCTFIVKNAIKFHKFTAYTKVAPCVTDMPHDNNVEIHCYLNVVYYLCHTIQKCHQRNKP